MTYEHLYLMIGVPMAFNAVLIGLLVGYINGKFAVVHERFTAVYRRFDDNDKRLDEMRDLWRAELSRVEEVLDAPLKHLETR